jgi:hypothetical protein
VAAVSVAAEIKLRAMRRLGEISKTLEVAPSGPGRGKRHPANAKPFKQNILSLDSPDKCSKIIVPNFPQQNLRWKKSPSYSTENQENGETEN